LHTGVLLAFTICGFLPNLAHAQDQANDTSAAPTTESADSSLNNPSADTPVVENKEPTASEALDRTLNEPQVDQKKPFLTQKTTGYIVGGVGVAGVVVGTFFGLRVNSKNDDSNSICPTGALCSPADQARYHDSVDSARSARTVSIISFIAGGAALATGAILVATAPKPKPATVSFVPGIDTNGRLSAALQGVW
jgi:hypothetical protein